MLLFVLVGLVGLLVDGGFLMTSFRQAQNAADAAALATATELFRGESLAVAEAAAVDYVRVHNGLAGAEVVINNPPLEGPYANVDTKANYAEVIVTHQIQTFFIHVLPGIERNQTVRARAVAGFEGLDINEAVIILDPRARPGLLVDYWSKLSVDGAVIDNSRGSGYDQYDQWLDTGYEEYAGELTYDSTLRARHVQFVGGVNDVDSIENFVDGGPNPLYAGADISPDPLADLPIPKPGNGADLTLRGKVVVEERWDDPEPTYLNPGIYEDILIKFRARAVLNPGIYILSPKEDDQGFRVEEESTVSGEGVMFYVTGSNYLDNGAGHYDTLDGPVELDYGTDSLPPAPDSDLNSVKFAKIDINAIDATITLTGLRDSNSPFDNMLIFQRRRNQNPVKLWEDPYSRVRLEGTIYAKWAQFFLDGGGWYLQRSIIPLDAQFCVGSMHLCQKADIKLAAPDKSFDLVSQVFLVE